MAEHPPSPPPGSYPPPAPGDAVGPGGPAQPGDARALLRERVGVLPRHAYTSWIRRVGAYVIDQLLFLALYALVMLALIVANARGLEKAGPIVAVTGGVLLVVFLLWNRVYRQGATGSSIGKSMLKFTVVGYRTGRPIGFWLSLVREIAHLLDGFCYIGYLLPLFTDKRQTIADMLLNTVCLPIEPQPARPPRRGRRPLIFAAVAAVVVVFALVVVLAIGVIQRETASRQVVLPFTGLDSPAAVAVDTAGAVYVTDSGNNRVLKLTAGEQTVLPFTGLWWPYGVTADNSGNVYVTDSQRDQVSKLASGSSAQTSLPFIGLNAPLSVAVATAGDVYVADERNNRVVELSSGPEVQSGLPFSGIGSPSSVAVDNAGAVYVTDPPSNRVLKLPPQ